MWKYRISKLTNEFKLNGIKGMSSYIRKRLVRKNEFFVFEIDLTHKLPVYSCSNEFVLRKATTKQDDVNKIVDFWLEYHTEHYQLFFKKDLVQSLIKDRLNAGELCYIAEINGELAHFHWISIAYKCGLNKIEPIKHLDHQPFVDAYSYNIFTHPKYRGRGLMLAVYSYIFEDLKRQGCIRTISCVGSKNIASTKKHCEVMHHTSNLNVTRYVFFDVAKKTQPVNILMENK